MEQEPWALPTFVAWVDDEWTSHLEHSAAVLAFPEPPGLGMYNKIAQTLYLPCFQTLVIKVSGVILSVVGGLAVGKVTTEWVTLVPSESEFLSIGGHYAWPLSSDALCSRKGQ